MQAMSRCPQLIAIAILFTFSPLSSAVDVTRGSMLSHSCAGCHGTDGKSPGAIPSINGKDAAFISTAMREFRDGKRASTVMGRHAKGYSDEEIDLIAKHFATAK